MLVIYNYISFDSHTSRGVRIIDHLQPLRVWRLFRLCYSRIVAGHCC